MPKIYSHDDAKIDTELDALWQKTDMYIVSETTPKQPRSGMFWWNPVDQKLKIFANTQSGWISIN